jgi:Zn-dependent M32 family carboxypeptidase
MRKSTTKKVTNKSKKTVAKKTVKKVTKPVAKKTVKKPIIEKVVKTPDTVIREFRNITKTKAYREFVKYVDVLQQRWDKAKKHENFDSYTPFLEKHLPEGFELVKLSKDFSVKMNFGKSAVVMVNVTPRATVTNLFFDLK